MHPNAALCKCTHRNDRSKVNILGILVFAYCSAMDPRRVSVWRSLFKSSKKKFHTNALCQESLIHCKGLLQTFNRLGLQIHALNLPFFFPLLRKGSEAGVVVGGWGWGRVTPTAVM